MSVGTFEVPRVDLGFPFGFFSMPSGFFEAHSVASGVVLILIKIGPHFPSKWVPCSPVAHKIKPHGILPLSGAVACGNGVRNCCSGPMSTHSGGHYGVSKTNSFKILCVRWQWGINGPRSACVFCARYAENKIRGRRFVLQVFGPYPWKSCQAKGVLAGGSTYCFYLSMLCDSFERVLSLFVVGISNVA